MPAVSGKQVLPLCGSAMILASLQPDLPCPIEILSAYCQARASRPCVPGSAGKSSLVSV